MVNDTIDATTNIFDFNLDSSATKHDNEKTFQRHSSNNALKSATNTKKQQQIVQQKSTTTKTGDQEDQEDQQKAINLSNLPENAANLSWTFFEHVSKLDNQLRGDEELSTSSIQSCESAFISPKNTNDIQKNAETELLMNSSKPKDERIVRKLNGLTPLTTIISTVNNNKNKSNPYEQTLSQQSPALIQKQQSNLAAPNELHIETVTNFQFTSPTATFKRKKQQHELKQQQQKQKQQQLEYQNYNDNNNCVNNQTTVATIINNSLPIEQRQEHLVKSNSPSRASIASVNAKSASTSTVLNATTDAAKTTPPTTTTKAKQSTIVADSLGIVANVNGISHIDNITTTHSTKIANNQTPRNRTLPQISTKTTTKTETTSIPQRAANATADTLDLVGRHKNKATAATTITLPLNGHDKRQSVTVKVKQGELQQQQEPQGILKHQLLPKRMTAGAAAATTNNTSSASSGNSDSDHHSNNNNYNTSTYTNKSNSNNNRNNKNAALMDNLSAHLELVGWRKKCLYGLLLLLMLLIITNLVLTLWILKVMDFTMDGMGQLKIVPGGIQLSGQALIMDMLRASTIRSRHGQPIAIESSRNFSINTRDANGMLENHLFLGHDKFECLAKEFRINDSNGRNLFSVNQNEVTIGAHTLRIDGEGGAVFRESIQTPHVRGEPGRELRLESPTRQLEMTAAKDINIQSRAGAIEVTALKDVRLSALDGSLRLESSKILMPNLRTAQPPSLGAPQSREHLHRVFQLCACSNGKLFLAAPHSICAGDDSTVCR